jgi:hypothetical protein
MHGNGISMGIWVLLSLRGFALILQKVEPCIIALQTVKTVDSRPWSFNVTTPLISNWTVWQAKKSKGRLFSFSLRSIPE